MTHGDWWMGIDLGGTNLRVSAVGAGGAVLASRAEDVLHHTADAAGSFGQVLAAAAKCVAELGSAPVAAGIGATGPVDVGARSIDNDFTLPPSLNGPVGAVLERALGIAVAAINDADAAALAEAWCGVAAGAQSCVSVTLGTGIGVGQVRDGRVVEGRDRRHAEAGHHTIDHRGLRCACGGRGCWELSASGTSIGVAMERLTGRRWRGADVAAAARAGDADALVVFDEYATAVAAGLGNVIAFTEPDVVVLGGGVTEDAALFLPAVRERLSAWWIHDPGAVRIEVGALGWRAGSVGAARAAMLVSGAGARTATALTARNDL
ncbi:ROK family protein [Curtobacterium sp. VKM Ac-1376]|uniref:ROK family protein n=1 Tax=Curtobacterium sp. VKM Ac-1376 TaxID=123312 RepID=UPI00188C6759|nr:ROK family protein [Curtobacterium sp. VKM Ac-1376]MBF4616001.1 ROK family protein [Curtobacterium sp. VKM Ac-1376]